MEVYTEKEILWNSHFKYILVLSMVEGIAVDLQSINYHNHTTPFEIKLTAGRENRLSI